MKYKNMKTNKTEECKCTNVLQRYCDKCGRSYRSSTEISCLTTTDQLFVELRERLNDLEINDYLYRGKAKILDEYREGETKERFIVLIFDYKNGKLKG